MHRVKICEQGILERANFPPAPEGLAIYQACARYTTGHRLKFCKLGSLLPVPPACYAGAWLFLRCLQWRAAVGSLRSERHEARGRTSAPV